MKAEPTEVDREAARLFEPAPGMRITLTDRLFGGLWARVSVTGEKMAGCYEVGAATWDAWGKEWQRMGAIDTDDPATVGCMLAQVRGTGGSIWLQPFWCASIPADAPYHGKTTATVIGRSWSVMTSAGSAGDGPTEGAALVAAMRVFRSRT